MKSIDTNLDPHKQLVPVQIKAECGHTTFQKDYLKAFGEVSLIKLNIHNGKIKYCHKCLSKMSIQCACCGKTIFVEDFVSLHMIKQKSKTPENAVLYSQYPKVVISCADCATNDDDIKGIWTAPGTVQRIPFS